MITPFIMSMAMVGVTAIWLLGMKLIMCLKEGRLDNLFVSIHQSIKNITSGLVRSHDISKYKTTELLSELHNREGVIVVAQVTKNMTINMSNNRSVTVVVIDNDTV